MLDFKTPDFIMDKIKTNYKNKRLELNLTQAGLASRSGVSLGSLKRFEKSGEISLKSLLKLSFILQNLDDFDLIVNPKTPVFKSIEEVIKKEKRRKKGQIK